MPGRSNIAHDSSHSAEVRTGAGRVAIVGGGISGLATAYELARGGADFTLFEASGRLGGIIETVRTQGFVIECGPDSWVAEKPWARDLAVELGLRDQILPSNDQWRATYLVKDGGLIPLPDGMRMMVPTKWEALLESPLFSAEARLAYRQEPGRAEELKASAPMRDESVASFVRRHFGDEVTETVAAPLLSGVFGGDIRTLSVRAVMPAFVKMEAEYGSLIVALQQGERTSPASAAIFSTLAGGMGILVDRIAECLPAGAVRLRQPVAGIHYDAGGWRILTPSGDHHFQFLVLATPPHITRRLFAPLQPESAAGNGERMSSLLPRHSSSAIVVALAFDAAHAADLSLPRGFGFLVPPAPASSAATSRLLACTFVDQKFPGRAPAGAALLRAFFGGHSAAALEGEPDETLIRLAREQLTSIVGRLPEHAFAVARRLPLSLPQYDVGHLERIVELQSLVRTWPGLYLVGSAYQGVGVSDLIRDGRRAACEILAAREND